MKNKRLRSQGAAILEALDEKWNDTLDGLKSASIDKAYNPLCHISFGSPEEVVAARKLAREIILPMGFSAENREDCIQMMALAFLSLSYQSFADNTVPFPTLDTVLSIMQGLVIEETDDYSSDGHLDETSQYRIMFRDFGHYLTSILSFSYFKHSPVLSVNAYEGDNRHVRYDDLKEYYPHSADVLIADEFTHPWIFKTALSFTVRDDAVVRETSYFCSLALHAYIDSHPSCTVAWMNKCRPTEFRFKPDWDEEIDV